ncbi:MAG: hypothetical protein QOH55_1024 [Microbacteriaceae bacterium]|jgi:hypothetical protein|nr:hypothetical protein [Microbacteriaceae bacterium]
MTTPAEPSSFDELLDLIKRLEEAKIFYQLSSTRSESVMVSVAVPGERWEIEVMRDGGLEIETFVSSGVIGDRSCLTTLFDRFTDEL